jgi:hypothetical protein
MEMIPLEPYKNREQVIAELKRCAMLAKVSMVVALLFVVLGVISDALDTVLVLHPTMWLLAAFIFGIAVIVAHMHVVAAKEVLGVEAENRKE